MFRNSLKQRPVVFYLGWRKESAVVSSAAKQPSQTEFEIFKHVHFHRSINGSARQILRAPEEPDGPMDMPKAPKQSKDSTERPALAIGFIPDMMEKMAETADPAASQAWVEGKLIHIIETALNPEPQEGKALKPQLGLARMTLMDLSKLKGYIASKAERKKKPLDLRSASAAELRDLLQNYLNQLSPGRKQEIQAVEDAPSDHPA
jgi:hypothetical protein